MKKSKLLTIIIIIILILLIIYLLYYLNIIPHQKYSNADFNIPTYKSNTDKDNDNIDDQTDILLSTKEYLKKKPKYKSKYYSTGYPDDEFGVCTDVVAFALLGAGYDLRELVNSDIKANREMYDIKNIDKNIDFRRVNNLKIYFKNTAISLTTDLKDIASWQGGDIVIFPNHIGIISNNRNKKGIPFVFHHASVYQKKYEEDILKQESIVAHYRLS